jgi:hypothetical protein
MSYDIDLLENQSDLDITGFNFKESGKLISGRTKVVKRFIQLLYTVQGSDKTDPEAGCQLTLEIVGLNMETTAVDLVVRTAVVLCRDQLINNQPENTPSSEKLIDVELIKTETDLDRCDITLNFTFGDTVSTLVPVTFDYNNA